MPIIEVRGGEILIDEIDLPILRSLRSIHVNENGYACGTLRIDGKVKWYRLHRLIMKPSDGLEVDHINGNRADNRRCNLRACTRRQNRRNAKLSKNNTSGFKGVSFYRRDGTYEAYIKINHRKHRIGYFKDKIEAARAYDTAALAEFGEFAKINGV